MAKVTVLDEKTIRIEADLEDAVTMIREAGRNVERYAKEITTIYEKMPEFQFVHFCFYAYDSAELFERMLGIDPKQYLSFSLDAPERFFYALYGGMAALYETASAALQHASPDQTASS